MIDSDRLSLRGNARERELLASAQGDHPDPAFKNRLLAGLSAAGVATLVAGTAHAGLVTGSGTTAAAGTPAAAGTTASAGTTATAGAAAGSALAAPGLPLLASYGVLAQWVGIGVFAGLATMGTARWVSSVTTAEPAAAASTRSALSRPSDRHTARSFQARTQAPPAETSAELPLARPGPTVATPSSITEEVMLLDAARLALRQGNTALALKRVQDYQSRFAHRGTLAPEAALVAIEAAQARGNHSAVVTRSQGFLARYPSSPHGARVRSLLEKSLGQLGVKHGQPEIREERAVTAASAPAQAGGPGPERPAEAARFPDTQ